MAQKRTLDLDKVIEKARQLIEKNGLTDTTMPSLAKALGVRSQSLYHYVSGRKQLISLVGASRINVLHEKLIDKLMGLSGKEALLAFADETRRFILHDAALSSILYQINEFGKDDAMNQAIMNIFALGEKFNLKKNDTISFHALMGAVLGYVWLDKSIAFSNESKEESDENYHQMILHLVNPVTKLQ